MSAAAIVPMSSKNEKESEGTSVGRKRSAGVLFSSLKKYVAEFFGALILVYSREFYVLCREREVHRKTIYSNVDGNG